MVAIVNSAANDNRFSNKQFGCRTKVNQKVSLAILIKYL
jgi:hypothetical protein